MTKNKYFASSNPTFNIISEFQKYIHRKLKFTEDEVQKILSSKSSL